MSCLRLVSRLFIRWELDGFTRGARRMLTAGWEYAAISEVMHDLPQDSGAGALGFATMKVSLGSTTPCRDILTKSFRVFSRSGYGEPLLKIRFGGPACCAYRPDIFRRSANL